MDYFVELNDLCLESFDIEQTCNYMIDFAHAIINNCTSEHTDKPKYIAVACRLHMQATWGDEQFTLECIDKLRKIIDEKVHGVIEVSHKKASVSRSVPA